MMYKARLFQSFFKATAVIPQRFVFRLKVFREDRRVQGRHIKGPAIIVSNHLSVYDYIALIFVFFFRTTRGIAAEVLFCKNIFLSLFLRLLGLVRVNRGEHDFAFEDKAARILEDGGIVVFHPEGRVPDQPGDVPPLPFKTGFAYLAMRCGVPVIPVYTNGRVFRRGRCVYVIGTPVDVRSLCRKDMSENENMHLIADFMRNRIQELERYSDERG